MFRVTHPNGTRSSSLNEIAIHNGFAGGLDLLLSLDQALRRIGFIGQFKITPDGLDLPIGIARKDILVDALPTWPEAWHPSPGS